MRPRPLVGDQDRDDGVVAEPVDEARLNDRPGHARDYRQSPKLVAGTASPLDKLSLSVTPPR